MNNETTDAQADGVVALTEPDGAPVSTARQAMNTISAGSRVAGDKLAEAARATSQAAGKAAVLIGDLNGDGKLDEEDAKIAAAKAKETASSAAKGAGDFLKDLAKHEVFKDVAAFAVAGAVISIPIPFVGPALGAAAGAVGGLVKNALSPRKK